MIISTMNQQNKLNPSKQGHNESKKSYASVATQKGSNDRNPTQGRRNWGGQEGQLPHLPFVGRGKGGKSAL